MGDSHGRMLDGLDAAADADLVVMAPYGRWPDGPDPSEPGSSGPDLAAGMNRLHPRDGFGAARGNSPSSEVWRW